MIVRCPLSMEAPSSTSSRWSSDSGWTEVAGLEGLLLLEGVRLPQLRTVEDSGTVSGSKPDLEPWGVLFPSLLESGRLPCGSSGTTSSCPGGLSRRHFGVIRGAGGDSGRNGVHVR